MSEPTAVHSFLPWIRRGLSTGIRETLEAGSPSGRANMSIGLTFNDGSAASVSLSLYGPGDVSGLDPRVVVRTWPHTDVFDAEPNYFPMVESDQVDLPWRYTPAQANDKDRLRPWLVLIVLREDEIEKHDSSGPTRKLPAVTVKNGSALPDLSQSWAWAHVAVSGAKTIDSNGLADLLKSYPERVVSRILCPRRLDPKTSYLGCLVPAFKRGQQAGLGEDVTEPDWRTPAWNSGDTSIRLPIYYQWRFQTGLVGDFEYLVRLIKPKKLPKTIGLRDMDVSDPGASLTGAATGPLGLEGALKAIHMSSTEWANDERNAWINDLGGLLNRPADLLLRTDPERVVAPPLYGQWHAARKTLDPGVPPPWFDDLNIDPRLRVSSGLGTLVVQQQHEQLLASAWQQVDGIRNLNEELRFAQLAREVSIRIYETNFVAAGTEPLIYSTAPLHSRITLSPITVRARLASSPIARGVLEPQYRRIARPFGPIGQRQGRNPRLRPPSNLIDRLNRGELSPAAPPPTPTQMATSSRVGEVIAPSSVSASSVRRSLATAKWLGIAGIFLIILGGLIFFTAPGLAFLAATLSGFGIVSIVMARGMSARARNMQARVALRDGTLSPATVRDCIAPASFVPTEPAVGKQLPVRAPGSLAGSGTSREAVENFRSATADLLEQFGKQPEPAKPLRSVRLDDLRSRVLESIDPRLTIGKSLQIRVRLAPGVVWAPEDPIEPIMAAPDFARPMYEPLRDLSQDWLLPGLAEVSPNTASLVKTNQKFIEAYMVGLSHEMARVLLFNEYPTDQRGTYFRQFWDSKGYIAPAGSELDPEALKDIKPIHSWSKRSTLGQNSSRRLPPGGEYLVLLVRAEVFRRYPNTIVYAGRASWQDGKRILPEGGEEQHPVFHGTLQPDVSFFGFELTVDQVKGGTRPDQDPGWFFVLQEHPSEPRFALDVANNDYGVRPVLWSDLSWGKVAASQGDLEGISYLDLDADLPDTTQVADPSGAAWHADRGLGPSGARASDIAYITLQQPMRVAIHGSQMIPEEG